MNIKDIADAADVATTTLFKHFPSKESLVFDRDEATEAELLAAVHDRPADRSLLDALRDHVLESWLPVAAHPRRADFIGLIESAPALQEYGERMWTRHAAALSAAIADDVGVGRDDMACRALARFVLDIPALTRDREDPRTAVEEVFGLLAHGWHPVGLQDSADS